MTDDDKHKPRVIQIISRERLLAGEQTIPDKKPRQTLQLNMVHRDEESDFYENDR